MTSNDYNLFISLLKIYDQNKVKKLVTEVLRHSYDKKNILETPHYTYVKGEIPIMLVAHCDTVCYQPVKEIAVMSVDKHIGTGLTNKEQAPLGADDRAGIFIILKLVANGYRPFILLTTDEEVGGAGAIAAADELWTPNVKFILELDRMGSNDAAMYDCNNQKFMDMLISYGFTPVSGTFSDICFFAPEWDIAAANLSVGYYHEHTPWEIVYVREMEQTLKRVQDILDNHEKFSYYTFEPAYTYNDYARLINSINFVNCDNTIPVAQPKPAKKSKKKNVKY